MSEDLSAELLQDFLTEASELIEQFDNDLIRLEEASDDSARTDVLNSIFRAVHTIKGGAGFLALDDVTSFAHAAEDALNRLRQGDVAVDAALIDTLLRSADVLRSLIEALSAGSPLPTPAESLLAALRAIAQGGPGSAALLSEPAPAATAQRDDGTHVQPLDLPPEKQDLLTYMVADLQDAAGQMAACAAQGGDAAEHLLEVSEGITRTAGFFGLPALHRLAEVARKIAEALPHASEDAASELLVRLDAACHLVAQQADALSRGEALHWPLDTFELHVAMLADGRPLPAAVAHQHEGEPARVLQLDGVTSEPASSSPDLASPTSDAPEQAAATASRSDHRAPEQTIRVEVSRLEELLNLVGQMVLAKNRILGIGRRLQAHHLSQELSEEITSATNDLDRLTGNLQIGVMRTRMQPLAKLFDRYPRVIRDVARSTQKKIQLQITGQDTEVDKSVLELLADPLVHILRNSADHGIELPDARAAAGKTDTGTIQLAAEHRGSHVHVSIRDDGRGLDRQQIGARAVERGLTSADQLAALSDQEVFEFIFAPGFSTAKQVSDLSGRGVGMDVVRTNVNKMNGTIQVDSAPGQGMSIELQIPLTVAIIPAMVVGVGEETYCVPLQNVVEIVRPTELAKCVVHGQTIAQLRDDVLPLIDLRQRLHLPATQPARFALVVNAAGQRAALLLDRLVGQQEIVIKPLDDTFAHGGIFSGATIQDTGEASLILDVTRLVRQANIAEPAQPPRRAA